jgi:hypothetical protein
VTADQLVDELIMDPEKEVLCLFYNGTYNTIEGVRKLGNKIVIDLRSVSYELQAEIEKLEPRG